MISQWPSPAKLNLFLYITGRRPDGYHQLQTLFQFLDYGDSLTLTPTVDGQIQLLTPVAGVANADNLMVRAAQQLMAAARQRGTLPPGAGAQLAVNKVLPMGGGLGGGSSNAATTPVGLNHLWKTGFTLAELAAIGLALGADVPVFVHGHAAFAEGVGELLQPADPAEKWYLVAHPGVSVATPEVFSDPQLTRNSPVRSLNELMQLPFDNDCEAVVRKRFREVDGLVSWLLEYAPSRLTGTGACVFAEFNTESAARQVLELVPEGIHGFVACGVNQSPLHRTLSGR